MSLESLENEVVEFVRERDYVSFVELEREFETLITTKGDYTVECCKNGVLWAGLSDEFSDMINRLLKRKRIFTHPASQLTYLIDGGCLKLPIPKNLPKDGIHVGYEQPVWIPACLRVVPYDPEKEKKLEQFHKMEVRQKKREIDSISQAIKRLVDRFDADKVEKAYYQLSGDVKKQWAERYGLKEAKGPVCAMRLLGKKCGQFDSRTGTLEKCECRPPGSDHASLWRYKTNPVVYVYQPYGLSGNIMNELGEYCRKWGFLIRIDTWPAWHYRGRVLFVEIYPQVGLFRDLKMGKIKPQEIQGDQGLK